MKPGLSNQMYLKSPFFKDVESTISSIHQLLEQKKASLAVAESLTGGLVSHLLTLKPQASRFFLGSVVCYSVSAKIKFLSVPPQWIEKDGVVSESLAQFMARGVRKRWVSDMALSLTGLAGPDKEEGDPPVGTVFVGFAGPKGEKVKKLFFEPEKGMASLEFRHFVQQKSAILALSFLKTCIEEA